MTTVTSAAGWAGLLKDYTRRNAGRLTRLEMDDPEVGAQWAEVDFPLRGVAYDHQDNRVEIMLGEAGSLEAHLTHSIEDPLAIDLLESSYPGGEVLRIAHGRGQTLLQFV
jgi:hypothetical protein